VKAVILAGGLGTRIAEETHLKPKPMIEIGGRPLLWHLMKIYSAHGIRDFVVCCGYKGYVIKEYFANYFLHMSDVTFDMANNKMEVHKNSAESWRVTLVDTGEETMTGGRLKRVSSYIGREDIFCFTYGDGLSNADITAASEFHKSHGKMATVTAVQPVGRFGSIERRGSQVVRFIEKPPGDSAWVSGGFFVLSPQVLDFVDGDEDIWEAGPLEKLVTKGEVMAFEHRGFWQPMDTLRDRTILEDLWKSKKAPWKVW
jgi:glucose-1-phosphate cytidylyltransferase